MMEKFGFHPTWINWIQQCISSSSFLILPNDAPFGQFSPSRGLRQGDPLSPPFVPTMLGSTIKVVVKGGGCWASSRPLDWAFCPCHLTFTVCR